MNLTALLLATLILVANATTDDDSAVRVPQAVTASSDTNKPGLVSVVATAISTATSNLRGPDSFIAVSDGHAMEHGQEEQLDKDEDQEDIAVTARTYSLKVTNYYHGATSTGTPCELTARFQFANERRYDSNTRIDRKHRGFRVVSESSDGDFQYVDLQIDCGDALIVEGVVLTKDLAIRSSWWGDGYPNLGWCMSTDRAASAWLGWETMLPGCAKVLRFEYGTLTKYGTGRVYDPSSCNADGTFDSTKECCTSSKKCGLGEGDCDSNDDCQDGLQCGEGNCSSDFGWGRDTHDCCYKQESCATEPNLTECIGCGANTPGHTGSCCTSSNKCGIGEGDCDNDDECMNELKCGERTPGHDNNCKSDFGWGVATHDCCYQP